MQGQPSGFLCGGVRGLKCSKSRQLIVVVSGEELKLGNG